MALLNATKIGIFTLPLSIAFPAPTHDGVTVQRGHGASNRGRNSDPVLDGLLERIESELDDTQRTALTRQATRRVMEELPVIPVFWVRSAWGVRSNIQLAPRGDAYTMATAIRRLPAP